jgi:hypothetical protein
MKLNNQPKITFYQNLGKLFYAIAASDGSVKFTEFNKLKQIVKTHWLNIDDIVDDYNSDAAFQIEIVFDWLNTDSEYNATDCYNDFVFYKKKHNALFTDKVKGLIMKTAGQIASSFAGVNKSELLMLAKLDMELKK